MIQIIAGKVETSGAMILAPITVVCPACATEVKYNNYVPLNCPWCTSALMDYKRLINSISTRVRWHAGESIP